MSVLHLGADLVGLLGRLLPSVAPQPVPTSLLGNSIAIGIIVSLHQQLFAFITGGVTLVMISEGISLARHDQRHARLAHGLMQGIAYVFGGGSAIPIIFVAFLLLGLWGSFFIALTAIAFWVFVIEAGLFLASIVLLYTVYSCWERLGAYGAARFGLLILLNVALFWQMFFIDIVASFMLTPNGGDTSQIKQVLNPTDLPLTAHRTVGNIADAAAILALFAAIRCLRLLRARSAAPADASPLRPAHSVGAMHISMLPERTPGEDLEVEGAPSAELRHWDFVGHWGVCFAVGFTLLQPYIGYSYAKEIQVHAMPAWYDMMFGDLSNVFLLQLTLLGLIFLFGSLYMFRRISAARGGTGMRWLRLALVVLVLALLLAAVPARFAWTYGDIPANLQKPWWEGGLLNPIGTMIPNKLIALFGMMFAALWIMTAYLRTRSVGGLRWGQTSRGLQRLVIAMAACIIIIMPVMGVIREHSRRPYLIYGELTIQGQQVVQPPPGLYYQPAVPGTTVDQPRK